MLLLGARSVDHHNGHHNLPLRLNPASGCRRSTSKKRAMITTGTSMRSTRRRGASSFSYFGLFRFVKSFSCLKGHTVYQLDVSLFSSGLGASHSAAPPTGSPCRSCHLLLSLLTSRCGWAAIRTIPQRSHPFYEGVNTSGDLAGHFGSQLGRTKKYFSPSTCFPPLYRSREK